MKQIDEAKAVDVLRRAGFTVSQIDRLSQLRRAYATSESDLTPLDYARLRFVRWLVTTGRLSDQIAEDDTSSKLDRLPLDYGLERLTDQITPEEASSKLARVPLTLTDQITLEDVASQPDQVPLAYITGRLTDPIDEEDAGSKQDQVPPKHTLLQYVQWFVKTIMTHDIWYVFSHWPSAEGQKA